MITANNGAAQKIDMENNFTMPADDLLFIAAGPTISVGSQTAMTNWSTNLISSGRIYYHKKGEILLNRAGADTLTARHEVVLKNLAFGQYDYFITSTSTPDTNVKTDWASFEIASTTPTAPTTPNQNTPTVPMGAPTTPTVTTAAKTGTTTVVSFPIINNNLYNKLKGKIILRVQDKGQAYYVSPKDKKLYSLGKPDDAFQLVRRLAIGMSDANLAKIPLGLAALSGSDSDNDGLPDALEQAVGTDPDKSDTDADGHSDKEELANGYSPWEKDKKLVFDKTLSQKFLGQILLQVQGRGQAWYINPADGKRYFLATAADAFKVMKKLGVGVSEASFKALGEK